MRPKGAHGAVPTGRVRSVVAIEAAPEPINTAAETDGWICTLAGVDAAELEGLMTPEQYADFCKP